MSVLTDIRNLFTKSTKESVKQDDNAHDRNVTTGVYIPNNGFPTPRQANPTQISALAACLKLIGETIASVDLNFFRETFERGQRKKEQYFPYFDSIINTDPNGFTNRFEMFKYWVIFSYLDGESYLYLDYNEVGALENIYLLDRFSVQRLKSDDQFYYKILPQNDNSSLRFDKEVPEYQVLRLLGFSYDGQTGVRLVDYCRNTINLTFDTESFASAYFNEGKKMTGVIESDKKIEDGSAKALKKRFQTNSDGGLTGVGILELGMKYKQLKIDADEGQIVTPRQHQIEEICRITLTPPHKIMHLVSTSYNSAEQLNEEFYSSTIRPKFQVIESEIDKKILFARFQKAGIRERARFDFIALLRANTTARAEYYTKLHQMGVYSADDVRFKEDEQTLGGMSEAKYNRLDTSTTEQQQIATEKAKLENEKLKKEING